MTTEDNPIWVTPDTDQGVDIQDDGSVRAVCIDEQGRIWGEQTLLDPTLDEWPGWSGFVELAGERFAARVRIERFDSANNQVVKVAAIRASTPPGWVPVDSQ